EGRVERVADAGDPAAGVDGEAVDGIVAAAAEALAPHGVADRAVLDEEGVVIAGADERAVAGVDGAREAAGDVGVAAGVDGDGVGGLVVAVAEAEAPRVVASGGEAGDEGVVRAGGLHGAAAEVDRAVEVADQDDGAVA